MEKLQIGIIGTGAIGSSLAALFAGNGYTVVNLGTKDSSLEKGKKRVDEIYTTLTEKEKMTKEQKEYCTSLISYTTQYSDLEEVSILFEAAFEDLDLKHKIFEQVEKNCNSLKAIASSTSAILPDDLKEGMDKYKDILMVAHPFNPPHIVPFVELVKSSTTTDESAQLVYDFLESCGRKVSVMKKSAPGFIANRLQHALLREAMYMVECGMVEPEDIDKALMYSFMPRYTSVGLFEHQDAFGLDMVKNVQNYLFPHLCDGKQASELVEDCCACGDFGQKSGKGTYVWTDEKKTQFSKKSMEPYWQYFDWNIPKV